MDSFLDGDSEMAALIRTHNWADTPLGPISGWSQALRTTVSLCLASNFPINIVWGDANVQLYNDGYRVICGDKHPAALGMNYAECWASAWPAVGGPFEQARSGATSFLENQRMFLFRNNYLEETFFTFSLSPIRDETGGIGGLFHPVTETTATMIAERRTRLVRDLTALLGTANSVNEVYRLFGQTLEQYELDLPFGLVYAHDGAGQYELVSSSGLHGDSQLNPSRQTFADSAIWPADILHQSAPIERHGIRPLLQSVRCGPYDEAPDTAFAVPLRDLQSELPDVILIAGASPRLPMTDDYRGLFDLIAAAFAAALARVKAAEEERQRMEALASIDRAKTAFFSNVSHEFRTPLTLMLGPLQDALESQALPPAQLERIDAAHRNALRLLKLVNSLLDFSRIEAGRNEARFAATDLASTTEELASSFRSACERAGLALEVSCALSQPVYVDPEMWETIVLNLLSNAFKFTLEGGISVSLRAVDGIALLTVTDTGVGIPQQELGKIFDRFHRIENQAGRTVEGSGIGLSLVRELVRLHGGEIDVDSKLDGGTCFRIRLPFGKAHLPADQIVAAAVDAGGTDRARQFADEALRWIPAAAPDVLADHAASAPAAGPYVILADDNADMRAYVHRLLLDGGYRVAAFDNGADALERALDGPPPDLVLSDVMMPRMNGFELLSALRSNERTRTVMVMLLSAKAGEEARLEGLNAGADDYMVKPFSARELRARVDAAVTLNRVRREAADRERELLLQVQAERSHAALLASEAHITSFFEQDAVGIVEADTGGTILRANQRFHDIVGHSNGSVIGISLHQLIHPDDLAHNKGLYEQMFRTGEAFNIENRYLTPGGDVVWVNKAVTGIRALPGQMPGSAMAVILDINQRKRIEAELSETSRRKDEFLAMLAHELRNPLAPISAAAQLMALAVHDPKRIKQTSEVITRQVAHMTGLVDDLLDVSRVTRGLIAIERTQQTMKAIITASIEQARPIMQSRRHRLIVDLTPEPDHVAGDRKRLVQIVTNLLNNAAKYTPEGGTIHVRSEVENGEVVVSIQDNGIGIDPAQQTRMFELFAQAERTADRSQGGLGLGLALVKSLVELHGGTVVCYSQGVGQGACFTVRLPLLNLLDHDDGDDAVLVHSVDGQASLKILVVDDNVDAARMLAMVLQVLGHEVLVAHRSPVALDMARQEQPDVCVLDIGLPEMDGNELAERLRASDATRGATLIALTGYSQESNRSRAMSAGFDHFLVKPMEIAKLTELLAGVTRSERH